MFRNRFRYTWLISRSGYLLIWIAIFLTYISFTRWIQILIFIPAFVSAIFIYSLFELYRIKKSLSFKLYNDKRWNYLKVLVKSWIKYNFILWNKLDSKKIEFLEPSLDGSYRLDTSKVYNLVFYVFWSFDIFRHIVTIWAINFSRDEKEKSFSVSEKYSSWKEIVKLDNLKSSMSETPYIKQQYDMYHSQMWINNFYLQSNEKITKVSRKRLWKYHILMVVLWFLAIAIEWSNILLNSIMLITILWVWFLRKKQWKIPELFKNIFLLIAFFMMLVLTFIQQDMSGPWSVFLIQILTIIYLFPRDFWNSFLYIFLLLFVFVAVSLFSNQIWFIFLFWVYLCISIYLLFFISWSESFEHREYKIGNKLSLKSFLWAYMSIVCLMVILYMLLPHGSASNNSNFWNSNNNNFISWFNEEISLENIQNIKEDRRKVIVVTDIEESDVQRLGLEYFRGKRYNYFDGIKWDDSFPNILYRYTPSSYEKSIFLNIKYYLNGNRYLYLPASPLSISWTNIEFWSQHNDDTILRSSFGINKSLNLDLEFQLNQDGKITDRQAEILQVDSDINTEVADIFEDYIASIPVEYTQSPELLSDYVENQSWFTYDLVDISENISDFLYGIKRGHCEYYATTLAIVLQHFWYNPTFVSWFGYGEYNALAKSYIVRASNAHTWVELYNEETESWDIYDPTPGQSLSARQLLDTGFEKIVEIYDFIDIKWYTYVANYTRNEQRKFYAYLISNFGYIIFIVISYVFLVYTLRAVLILKTFIFLSKRDKILFILMKKYSSVEQIFSHINTHNPKLARELQEYLYWDIGNISLWKLYEIILYKKHN